MNSELSTFRLSAREWRKGRSNEKSKTRSEHPRLRHMQRTAPVAPAHTLLHLLPALGIEISQSLMYPVTELS